MTQALSTLGGSKISQKLTAMSKANPAWKLYPSMCAWVLMDLARSTKDLLVIVIRGTAFVFEDVNMPRSVKEWIGKTDNTAIPPRVKQRVYDRDNGACHICKLAIKSGETWHADHVKALIEGGENRETNLAPTHAHCNLAKAAGEKTRKAKVQRMKEKNSGARKPKGSINSQSFAKTEKHRAIDKSAVPELPRPSLFRKAG